MEIFSSLFWKLNVFTNNDRKLLEWTFDHIHVSMCVSASWAISGTIGTNMTMSITQLEKVQMLRKLKTKVTRVWRFQICNQIIEIDNIYVDIRYSMVWLNL